MVSVGNTLHVKQKKTVSPSAVLCVIHICGLDYLGKNATKKNFSSGLCVLCELKSVTGEVDTEGSLKLAVKP
jgi:hypothetical protein